MKKKLLIAILVLAGITAGALFLFDARKDDSQVSTVSAKEVYYCPMHKEYTSDKPGNCPICSMKLVKKEGSDEEAMKKMLRENAGAQTTSTDQSSGKGSIFISPERRQTLGVRSVPAVLKPLKREIRTVGKIAYDETRITHIHARLNGWIEQVFVDFVGEPVKKGQPLFTLYSPELLSTQEEYLLALKHQENLGKSSFDWIAKGSGSLADSARERLKLWGVSENEIQQIAKTGKARRTLTTYSPVSGVVTQRSAYHHGTYITPETELYTIVDLSTVWLIAEIYEKDVSLIKTGQRVVLEFPYTPDKKRLDSKVEFFYPYLDPETRTGQIRIQLKNPRNELKPDQFVNVFLAMDEQVQLVVPGDAVLNTGERQYVFVDLGNGYFDPREVRVGMQGADETSILAGISEGERVVTAANFLLDSEARLRGFLENMGKPRELQAQSSSPKSGLQIQLLEPKKAKTGENEFTVSIKQPSGAPVESAEVEITLFMPQMGNMPPMTSKGMLLDQGNGIYKGTVDIQMAWTWETTITVKKEGRVLGSTKTTVTAR